MAAAVTTAPVGPLSPVKRRPEPVVRSSAPPSAPPSATPTAGPGLAVQMLTAGTAACFADLVTFPLDTVSGRTRPRRELGYLKIAPCAGEGAAAGADGGADLE